MSKKEYGAIWYKVYIYINLRIFIFRVLVCCAHLPSKSVGEERNKNPNRQINDSHTKSESSPKKNKTNKMLDKVPQMCEVFKN